MWVRPNVAELAGLPKAVTARAEEVLAVLEKGEDGGALARFADDLPLFSAARRRAEPAAPPNPRPRLCCATSIPTN
jgi:DNA mismatch repair protein MutS